MDETAVSVQEENQGLVKDKRRVSLPLLRFCNVAIGLLFLDVILSLVLWLMGGDSTYMKKHVVHFNFRDSVFDLAVLSVARVIVLVYLFTKLESLALETVYNSPYEQELVKKKKTCYRLAILVTFLCLAYSVTKGVLVYLAWSNDSFQMHTTYYVLVIASAALCLAEFCLSVASAYFIRKLLKYVVLNLEESSSESETEKKVDLRRLLTLAKSEFGILSVATFALFISTGSQMAAPLFFGEVINAANKSERNGMGRLNKTILILFGVYTVGALASLVRSWLYTLAGQRLVARVRKEVFNAIAQQGISFFDLNRTGELINRLSSDTQVIQNAVTVNISMLARFSLQIIGSIVIMFILCPKLAAVLISVVPIIGVGAQRYGQYLRNLRKIFQDKLASSSTTAEETFSSIRTVRSFSQEKKAMNLYKKDIDDTYAVGEKISFATGLFNGCVGIIAQGAICLVLWYGGKLVYEGELSVGILTAFMLYTLNVAMAFAFLSSLYGEFMQAVGASFRIFDLLDRKPEIHTSGGTILPSARLTMAFQNVCFSYPTRPENKVIKNLSFTVEPGEKVALVGPSGGGKSTLINLIERFYDPDSGQIFLGDTSLSSLDPEWFRKRIALVGQEPVLFGITIAENISYGRDASQEEIEEAAKQANAHSFIMTFEEGYATQVGERGIKLSGGQKQRVAIARALLMDPDILLLDEATSALDSESEHLVKEAIERAMENRTVLVIAHRLSTVKNASKVIVIENGTIAEQGNHRELLSRDGVYRRLVYRQLSTTDDENIN